MLKNEKIQLHLDSVNTIETDPNTCRVTLKAFGTHDVLTLMIGSFEGRAIYMGAKGLQANRPLTHDLFAAVMGATGMQLWRVLIYRVEKNVFYSYIYFRKDFGVIKVDARTSDAIALAVRMGAPIFTYKELLENALIGKNCNIKVEDDFDEFKEIKILTPGIDSLKQQLEEAVQNEDYEKAAQLRDQLKEMGD